MKLGEPVSYFDLEAVSFVEVTLYSLCVPSGFGQSAGSDISMNHVFPQGLLAAITLVGGGARDGRSRARALMSQGFSSAPCQHLLTGCVVSSPDAGAAAFRGGCVSWLYSL